MVLIPGADEFTSDSEASSDEEVQQSARLPQLAKWSPGADDDGEEIVLIPGADEFTSDSEASSDEEDQPSLASPRLEILNLKIKNPGTSQSGSNNGQSLPQKVMKKNRKAPKKGEKK